MVQVPRMGKVLVGVGSASHIEFPGFSLLQALRDWVPTTATHGEPGLSSCVGPQTISGLGTGPTDLRGSCIFSHSFKHSVETGLGIPDPNSLYSEIVN